MNCKLSEKSKILLSQSTAVLSSSNNLFENSLSCNSIKEINEKAEMFLELIKTKEKEASESPLQITSLSQQKKLFNDAMNNKVESLAFIQVQKSINANPSLWIPVVQNIDFIKNCIENTVSYKSTANVSGFAKNYAKILGKNMDENTMISCFVRTTNKYNQWMPSFFSTILKTKKPIVFSDSVVGEIKGSLQSSNNSFISAIIKIDGLMTRIGETTSFDEFIKIPKEVQNKLLSSYSYVKAFHISDAEIQTLLIKNRKLKKKAISNLLKKQVVKNGANT